jgi:hypothetical protein
MYLEWERINPGERLSLRKNDKSMVNVGDSEQEFTKQNNDNSLPCEKSKSS